MSGLTVVELSTDVAGRFCGKILAQAGASVVRLERPGEAAFATRRPGLWNAFLNHEKDVRLLEAEPAWSEIDQLLAGADCALTGTSGSRAELPPAYRCEALLARHPQLICVSTSPFGGTGPYSTFRGRDLALSALSGFSDATPGLPDWQPDGEPPAQCLAPLMELGSGAVAALAVQAALYGRQRGLAAPRHVEVAGLEVAAWLMISEWGLASYGGIAPGRRRKSRNIEPNCFLPCKNGYVTIIATTDERWRRLVETMGSPAWAEDERFATTEGRAAHAEMLHELVAAWARDIDGDAFMAAAQARGLPCTAYRDLADVPAEAHLRAVEALRRVDGQVFPEDPVRVDGARRRPPARPAPAPAMANPWPASPGATAPGGDGHRPLAGLRVLDLTQMVAGPLAGQYLAALGADVVLVESRQHLVSRAFGPFGGKPDHDGSNNFNHVNRGKRSVEIDLTTERGRALFATLVSRSDVVLENFSRRAADKLGLGYDRLAADNPRLIVASISAFGRTGPWGGYVSHHAGVAALSGLTSIVRDEQNRPRVVGAIFPDVMTGTYTAGAIIQALAERDRTGRGTAIEVSMLDMMLSCMGGLIVAGETWLACPPRGFFATGADRGFVAIDDVEPGEVAKLSASLKSKTRHQAMRELQAAGRSAGAVLDALEVMADEHLLARGFVQELDHPVVGRRRLPGVPWLFDGRRPDLGVTPILGSATTDVMCSMAGLGADQIDALRQARILW